MIAVEVAEEKYLTVPQLTCNNDRGVVEKSDSMAEEGMGGLTLKTARCHARAIVAEEFGDVGADRLKERFRVEAVWRGLVELDRVGEIIVGFDICGIGFRVEDIDQEVAVFEADHCSSRPKARLWKSGNVALSQCHGRNTKLLVLSSRVSWCKFDALN